MSISAITGTSDPTALQAANSLDLFKWRFPTTTSVLNLTSATTSDPALLQTSASVDLFKQRFPDATEVLNTPATEAVVNTVDPALQQAAGVDAFGSLLSAAATTAADTTAAETTTAVAAAAQVSQGGTIATESLAAESLLSADAIAAQAILEEQNAAVLAAALVQETLAAEQPDSMSAMLRGAYLAPVLSAHFSAPYRSGLSASTQDAIQDVDAATPKAPISEYANSQSFNPNANFQHSPTSETVAAHLKRLAQDAGMEAIGPQIVSGAYGIMKPHLLDELA